MKTIFMSTNFEEIACEDVDGWMRRSMRAFEAYARQPLSVRARLMRAIATELDACGDDLIHTAMRETNLPEARLRGERGRTIFQLNAYADACERGDWLEVRIDRADPAKTPPKPDIRKMLVPLGPVLVYGASNFPFAYSTAGGDTACALAAGCSVVVKAHPAHPATSETVAAAVGRAVAACELPEDLFLHVHATAIEVGKALVTHPCTRAVGFTGSHLAGRTIFDWACTRKDPIPVFAEMGSVNPVFLLPAKLEAEAESIARMYAGSITLGVGQFCTNPGIIIGPDGPGLDRFMETLASAIADMQGQPMLHRGIAQGYVTRKSKALAQSGVTPIAEGLPIDDALSGVPSIATVDGRSFIGNPILHEEVFGPFSLVVRCRDVHEMLEACRSMEGQLTATVMGTEDELAHHPQLLEAVASLCGRIILNGVPTGVEVCLSMQHGGPYPACTDSRFTSVGADGIKRFARPQAYQNWPDALLPEALKDGNPLGLLRTVDDRPAREALSR
jgi:NADP-dependent aldehyde dehydrogenase